MATLIRPDGTREEGIKTDLKSLQDAVGGYIEVLNTRDGMCLVVNEEGKQKGLPFNSEATKLYQYGEHDQIVGNVVLCNCEEIQ